MVSRLNSLKYLFAGPHLIQTDEDIRRQIVSNPDAAPDMAPEIDVRAIRQAMGMTQAEFAAYEFSVGRLQE